MADVPLDPTVKRIVLNAPMGAAEPSVPQAGGEIKRRRSRSRKRGGGEGEAANSMNSANSPVIVNKVGASGSAAPASAVGGGATSPGTMQQLAASHIPGNNSSKAVGAVAPFTATQAGVGTVAPAAANDPKTVVATGGAKVTLVKSRKAPRKLVLAAAASKGGAPQATSHKRKTAKKIKVSLSGLGRGLRRATTIRKKASKHTLEEVKKALVEAKLVKPDTKAPEDILRQMYADYMTLKKKAL